MPNHTFYGYSADAFSVDPETENAVLTADYEPAQHRSRFEVSDDDAFADGDSSNDEVGDDTSQTGTVFAPDGTSVSSGQIYIEEVRWYESPDGNVFSVSVFEIDGEVVGFVPNEPMEPGTAYTYIGSSEAGQKVGGNNNNAANNNYAAYKQNRLACFGPGTMITTQEGDMPVEWLDTSDLVLTRDNGFQPILWIGRSKLPAGYFRQYPDERPVCIPAHALGPSSPTHDLQVTGDHRLLIRSMSAELHFSSSEVLAPAKAWVDAGRAKTAEPTKSYTVTHILCATHQIIAAQGAWVESMFTGPETMRRLNPLDRQRLDNLLHGETMAMQTARPCVTRREALFLLTDEAAQWQDGMRKTA